MSAADAEKLRIPFANYEKSEPIIGFGKGNVPTVKTDKFVLVMRSDGGITKQIEMPVSVPDVPSMRKMDQNILNHAYTIPTLLGLDFLEVNKLKLMINIPMNEAYLEDV